MTYRSENCRRQTGVERCDDPLLRAGRPADWHPFALSATARYGAPDITRLEFRPACRDLGFDVADIRDYWH